MGNQTFKYNKGISEVATEVPGQASLLAVIDSGAPETVSGKGWINDFMDRLNEEQKKLVTRKRGWKKYKFGNSRPVIAKETLGLPMVIAGRKVLLTTDVVDVDIPLLIGKSSLKKAEAIINFQEDMIQLFGKKENLIVNSSGHYMIPVQNNVETRIIQNIKRNHISMVEEVNEIAKDLKKAESHKGLSKYGNNHGNKLTNKEETIEYNDEKQFPSEKVLEFNNKITKWPTVKNQEDEKVYICATVEKEEIGSAKELELTNYMYKRSKVYPQPPAETMEEAMANLEANGIVKWNWNVAQIDYEDSYNNENEVKAQEVGGNCSWVF